LSVSGRYPYPVSDRGEIAFRGELDGSNDQGIWFGTRDTLALVARLGDIAPGAGGLVYRDELSNPPILNDNGKIGFTVELSDRQGSGVWSGTPKKLSLLARSGDVAPGSGGATFTGFDELGGALFALNNNGEFVIFSSLRGPGVDDSNNVGIWFRTREPQALVVREGDVAPGTGGATFGDLILDKISINDDGQVAFAAPTESGVGIWISSKGRKLELIARQGGEFEVAPDDERTIANFQDQPEPGGISDIFDFEDGGLVFALDFTDGTSGIFTARLGDHRTAAAQ
jgi:hypothetical protein